MISPRESTFVGRLTRDEEDAALRSLDETSEEFLLAFCELLDIQSRRNTDPIVVMPDGPVTLH
jgi:hypothetical protein